VSKVKSPQQKKTLSLQRDRRNVFGENSKASRKNIHRGKQRGHMQERRAVSSLLSRLGEKESLEADVQTRLTIIKSRRRAFKKAPDQPLGIVVKEKLKRRRELAQSHARFFARAEPSIHAQGIFDVPYVPGLHKRMILSALRSNTDPQGWHTGRSHLARVRSHERKEAARWKEAILRDAPLLKGFLAEEPQWRDRILRWCEEILGD